MEGNRYSPAFTAAACVLFIFVCAAVFAPWLAPYEPNELNRNAILAPMSEMHLLGTDALGRDMFSRLLYGARVSIGYAVAGAACTIVFGTALGILSGYFGGKIDLCIQGAVQIFQGIPGISLMIAIAGIMGPGPASILLAVTLTSWTACARVVRAEVMKIRHAYYVSAVKVLGAGDAYIIRQYILPNILPYVSVLWTVRIGTVLLSVSTLGFLGLGIQPPQADWGVMIYDAKTYFRSYPWLLWAPGLCIALLSLSVQVLGDEWRDRQSVHRDGIPGEEVAS